MEHVNSQNNRTQVQWPNEPDGCIYPTPGRGRQLVQALGNKNGSPVCSSSDSPREENGDDGDADYDHEAWERLVLNAFKRTETTRISGLENL